MATYSMIQAGELADDLEKHFRDMPLEWQESDEGVATYQAIADLRQLKPETQVRMRRYAQRHSHY